MSNRDSGHKASVGRLADPTSEDADRQVDEEMDDEETDEEKRAGVYPPAETEADRMD